MNYRPVALAQTVLQQSLQYAIVIILVAEVVQIRLKFEFWWTLKFMGIPSMAKSQLPCGQGTCKRLPGVGQLSSLPIEDNKECLSCLALSLHDGRSNPLYESGQLKKESSRPLFHLFADHAHNPRDS